MIIYINRFNLFVNFKPISAGILNHNHSSRDYIYIYIYAENSIITFGFVQKGLKIIRNVVKAQSIFQKINRNSKTYGSEHGFHAIMTN